MVTKFLKNTRKFGNWILTDFEKSSQRNVLTQDIESDDKHLRQAEMFK